MKKIAILILLITLVITQANAQEQPNKRKLADDLFERYEYFKSLNIYLDLANRSNAKVIVVERVADCYRFINDYANAEAWYERAVAYPNANKIDTYYYAEMLLRNKKIKEAREQYQKYYADISSPDQLKFKLGTCDSAEKWMKIKVSPYATKNEEKFNTKYSDWGLNYSGSSDFIFTSDRVTSDKRKDIYNRTGDGYFKMYHATTNLDLVIPFELNTTDNPLFEGSFNIGPMVINAKEDTAYITITTTLPKSQLPVDKKVKGSTQSLITRRLQLIIATKVKGQWGNFKSFSYNNLKQYSVGHPTLSKNGNILYFASDMPGGEGKTDIWYCQRQSNGSWGLPVNCGKTINTAEDDVFPNAVGDSTLYYSSTGLPGMGGLDVFKAKGSKNEWTVPENLKTPVNSTSDDFYYVTQDGVSGYFSSNREGGKGNDDIYSFGYKPLPFIAAASPVSGAPKITTPGTFPVGQSAPGNITASAKNQATPAQPITSTSSLKKGETFALPNIYYDLNKSDIRPDATLELDKLVTILKNRPALRIEIGSHTDSRAPSSYNLALSNRRAATVVAYLVKHGIASYRLVPHGYGDTRLLNKCAKGEYCTEEEHQLNRRTEVRVLSNDEY